MMVPKYQIINNFNYTLLKKKYNISENNTNIYKEGSLKLNQNTMNKIIKSTKLDINKYYGSLNRFKNT
jgi:hypothetical protein